MRNAAEQSKVYENSLMIINRTVKKNELTMLQLEKVDEKRAIYIPLGRAY